MEIVSVAHKFTRIRQTSEQIKRMERRRSALKKRLNEAMSDRLSLNSLLKKIVQAKKAIKNLSRMITNLHNEHNAMWSDLKYEDKCRYRYWSNNESIPKIKTPIEYEYDQGKSVAREAPLNCNSVRVTRASAFKLIKHLTDFLETGADSMIIAE